MSDVQQSDLRARAADDSEELGVVEELDFDDIEESPEELMQEYEDTFRNIAEGEVVTGTILAITDKEVLVDVGYKSEGTIPLEEFRGIEDQLKVGAEIDVYLESTEDSDGLVVLSKEKADKIKVWDEIHKAYENGQILDGKVIERIKGGLTVDIGVRAFLPGSQIDIRPVKNPDGLIGRTIQMKVIKLNKRRGNIVLSRRVLLEEEREKLKRETLKHLAEGSRIVGVVKNITDYGAFVDLGGIDGLLHITDMSWGRINHPSDMLKVGDEIEVVILKFDREKEKVSLGLKQKTIDPWEAVLRKYPLGTHIKGTVISITDYGAFVELEKGIEGLVHISEMSWTRRVRHPSNVVNIGDEITAVVLDVDPDRKRISLGMKQTEPSPWYLLKEKYPVGTRINGRVRNLTNFGAFVEVEEGIDGLVHISDMSWTTRISHPSEVLKRGDEIEVIILDIDPEKERLSLGLKQLQPDPWEIVAQKYTVGDTVRGTVVRLSDFGAFVELEDGIEGLAHISEIDRQHVARPDDILHVGDECWMKIIKIDPTERKIGLSIRAYQEEQERRSRDAVKHWQEEQRGTLSNPVLDKSMFERHLRPAPQDRDRHSR
ncbi:MAG: 30S ribosomal protein S1 [Candidatus Schekmanbacteria bacterium]|nr:30S ribosomal protein S1 [Candidatus Schekmanbacteria bacterium]